MGFKPETFKWLPLFFLTSGFGMVFVSVVLSLGGFNFMLRLAVKFQTRIVDGSNTFRQWKDIPINPLLKIHFFNITNPEDLSWGMKAKLQEVGPYVYMEQIYKREITFFEETDSVKYHMYRDYTFRADLSRGKESDVITMINLPFVAIAGLANDFTDVDYILNTLDDMISKKGEKLIRREKVRDILFDGFSVQTYIDLANDPLVKASGQAVEIPPQLANGKMGIFEGRNGSHQGWVEVKTGVSDSEEFGKVVAFEERRRMTVWRGDTCNSINGTDGMIYPPFLYEKDELSIFLPEACRSIGFRYTKTLSRDLIPARRYQLTNEVFQSPLKNEANWCFCPKENLTHCDIDGILPVAPCFGGAPLYLSNPHFLFADARIRNMVIGLDPSPDLHWGYMDLNPTSGVTLIAQHRLQFNIHLKEYISMPTFSNISEAYLPIMWLEEGGTLVGINKVLLQLLSLTELLWPLAMVGNIFTGAVICPAIALFILKRRQGRSSNSVKSASINDDDDDD